MRWRRDNPTLSKVLGACSTTKMARRVAASTRARVAEQQEAAIKWAAVCMIQAHFRGRTVMLQYRKLQDAAVKIQARIRGMLANRRMARLRAKWMPVTSCTFDFDGHTESKQGDSFQCSGGFTLTAGVLYTPCHGLPRARVIAVVLS